MGDADLYSGYNDYDAALDVMGLEQDSAFQQAVKTAHGNRPGLKTGYKRVTTAAAGGRLTTAAAGGRLGTAANRMTTAAMGGRLNTGVAPVAEGSEKRPMTAVKAAGFSSRGLTGQAFDPMNQSKGPAPALETEKVETPEEQIKQLESKVNKFVEESAFLVEKKEYQQALDKAKEAGVFAKQVTKLREQHLGPEQINFDLTYSVLVNLANVYQKCEMYTEATNTYMVIVKNKAFDRAGRLRVNMGNIYFKQKQYIQAVKQYRMALDQIPPSFQTMRNHVMRNIGHAFVCMGQYADAQSSYEHVLDNTPIKELDGVERKTPGKDFNAAFNLALCCFAVGDRDKMKRAFQRMLSLRIDAINDDERYLNINNDTQLNLFLDAVKADPLRQAELEEKRVADKYIILTAKLIAPVVEDSFAEGYDWCIDVVKASEYADLASELEITKAIAYLKMKDFEHAIEGLKAFEKKDSKMLSTAATNLSFLYFLEGQHQQANKYAEVAVNADRYNPNALVNRGNCEFVAGDMDKALGFYQEALAVESHCTEALYNLGLVYKKRQLYEEALDCFLKLHAILRNSAEVVLQIGVLYEFLEDYEQASEWYLTLVSINPTDPNALAHLGDVFDRMDDKSQAFQYHYESFRYFPSCIDTISWLGAYYVDSQFVEKAIPYFERAVQVQPQEVKWRLMIASCHRRAGNYQKALDTYKVIHTLFPENIECLRFLARISSDMGLAEAQEYAMALKKAEQSKEKKDMRSSAGSVRSGSGRRTRSGRLGSGSGSARDSMRDSMRDSAKDAGARRRGERDDSARHGRDDEPDSATSTMRERHIDASYDDPLGAMPERPKTAAVRREEEEEDWGELDETLLPE